MMRIIPTISFNFIGSLPSKETIISLIKENIPNVSIRTETKTILFTSFDYEVIIVTQKELSSDVKLLSEIKLLEDNSFITEDKIRYFIKSNSNMNDLDYIVFRMLAEKLNNYVYSETSQPIHNWQGQDCIIKRDSNIELNPRFRNIEEKVKKNGGVIKILNVNESKSTSLTLNLNTELIFSTNSIFNQIYQGIEGLVQEILNNNSYAIDFNQNNTETNFKGIADIFVLNESKTEINEIITIDYYFDHGDLYILLVTNDFKENKIRDFNYNYDSEKDILTLSLKGTDKKFTSIK